MDEIVEETAKERIKRKKKERAKALLDEAKKQAETQPCLEEVPAKASGNIEVLEIFPRKKHKIKWLAQGTAVIKMHDMGLKIKNIRYTIDQKGHCNVQPPFEYYPMPDGEKDAYVPTVKFDDKSIWKEACNLVRESVLEHHREDLSKIEDTTENYPHN